MNISSSRGFLSPAFTLLDNYTVKHLSNTHKKVTLVALSIFVAISSCFLIYRLCFKAKRQDTISPKKQKHVHFQQVSQPSKQQSPAKDQPVVSPKVEPSIKADGKKTPESKSKEKPSAIVPSVPNPPKSVWKEVKASFPNPQEAEKLLSENDAFLKSLSSFDRKVRMKQSKDMSHSEFVTFYKKQVCSCSSQDQKMITDSLKEINQKLKEYGIQLPETLHFIRTTGKEEIPGTAAYCKNQDVIVFNWLSPKLIAHELFHIYSRNQPEMRKKLYALIGFHVMEKPLVIPDALKNKRLVNPDVPNLDAYIMVKYQGKEVPAVPFDLYDLNYQGPGQNRFLQGIYHKFAVLEKNLNGEMQFKLDQTGFPILFNFDEAGNFKEQVGENTTYIDSAEEILADNFALMIMNGKGKTPELIQKMETCFKNNRSS